MLARDDLVRVWLSRKLADVVNGIDLKGRRVGDVVELRAREAMLLLGDGYAEVDRRLRGERRGRAVVVASPDRRPSSRDPSAAAIGAARHRPAVLR